MKQPIRGKLSKATAAALAAIAAGLVLMAFSVVQVQRSILAEDRDKLMVIAKSTANSIDNYLEGCLTGIYMTQKSPSFAAAATLYRNGGDSEPLLEHLRVLASADHPAITDVYLLDADSRVLLRTAGAESYFRLNDGAGPPGDGKLRVYRNRLGDLFLGVVTAVDGGHFLLSLLDVQRLYHRTISFATLGEKGYVMIKHSRGLILMHPVRHQIGSDVLAGRQARYPDLDYSELEQLIANQERGLEAIETYHSYWWAEESPVKVMKISAYTPARIQNDFLIVSAVVDHKEAIRPIQYSSAALITSACLVFVGVMAIFLRNRRENQRQIERENLQLKEINRQMDEMARKREEMQHDQRLQMIGTLTGGIAHEFRNLLTPIMGYSGLLREGLAPDSPLREDIDEIYDCAVRAKEIIQQITSLSRKNLDPVFEPLRLDDVVPGILKMAASAKPADVEIVQRLDFGGKAILGNATQINQVVLNLCNNAFQAMRNGKGHLRIEGRTENRAGREDAVLIVRDDGVGMEPAVLDRIFDPFFTTKRAGEGTGLGLSVVQNIVDMHGGTVSVESSPGVGTAFTLRFPTVRPEAMEAEPEAPSARKAETPASIILVEDDPQVLRLLDRGLTKRGFEPKSYREPMEALRELERGPCRLLVTDYNMPRMTGAELAMRARELHPGIKILILTGFADKDILDYLRKEIIDGYQIKPVPLSELVEKIHALFE